MKPITKGGTAMKWEYSTRITAEKRLDSELDAWGKSGWELIEIERIEYKRTGYPNERLDNDFFCIFKRPKTDE